MEFTLFIDKLCIVLVLYRKQFKETPLFNLLNTPELSRVSVFVYDNSPYPQFIANKHIIYVHDAANSGISKAYNEGVKFALQQDKKWALFLDQDTQIELPFFHTVLVTLSSHPQSIAFVPLLYDQYGIVSPFRWSLARGKRIRFAGAKLQLRKFRFANSGLLMSCDAFKKAGGYVETIPLDFSDIAFGERLQDITDHFVVMDIRLSHSFSGSMTLSWEEALQRFNYFCLGLFAMGNTFGNTPIYFMRGLLRTLHLTFRYKKFIFLKMFIHHVPRY